MRVSCPACATAYEVPDRVLTSGRRMLRCARCGNEWRIPLAPPESVAKTAAREPTSGRAPDPDQEPAAPELVVPDDVFRTPPKLPEAERPRAREPEPAERRRARESPEPGPGDAPRHPEGRPAARHPEGQAAAWLGWAGTIVLLAVVVWAAYVFRAEVMHVWPASERLYALLGVAQMPAPVPQ